MRTRERQNFYDQNWIPVKEIPERFSIAGRFFYFDQPSLSCFAFSRYLAHLNIEFFMENVEIVEPFELLGAFPRFDLFERDRFSRRQARFISRVR